MNKGKYEYINQGNQQVDYVGRVYDSKEYGPYTVLRELIGIGMKSRIFEIEFHNTGYHAIVTRGKMISGEVKDKYVPSVYGIGYLGDEYYITDPEKRMYYKTWADMIKRCYCPETVDYKDYGAKGVTVDPRWYNFTTFYFDIRNIPGFWNKRANTKLYKLDKDYLQQHLPHNKRVYSKDTCVWISNDENALMSGRDNNGTKCYGTIMENEYFVSIILGIKYAKFRDLIEAACLFNYVYPIMRNREITLYPMINNVPMIPFEKLLERNIYYKTDVLQKFYDINKDILHDIYNSYLLGNPIT